MSSPSVKPLMHSLRRQTIFGMRGLPWIRWIMKYLVQRFKSFTDGRFVLCALTQTIAAASLPQATPTCCTMAATPIATSGRAMALLLHMHSTKLATTTSQSVSSPLCAAASRKMATFYISTVLTAVSEARGIRGYEMASPSSLSKRMKLRAWCLCCGNTTTSLTISSLSSLTTIPLSNLQQNLCAAISSHHLVSLLLRTTSGKNGSVSLPILHRRWQQHSTRSLSVLRSSEKENERVPMNPLHNKFANKYETASLILILACS